MNAIQSTFNLLFVVRKHRLLKNGEAPIYLRITINGEIADITVGRSVRSEMWDQRRECSLGKLHRDKELNHYLETVKTRLYQIHREFEIDGIPITARGMRDRYLGRDDSRVSFFYSSFSNSVIRSRMACRSEWSLVGSYGDFLPVISYS